jgi:hypothetical protein
MFYLLSFYLLLCYPSTSTHIHSSIHIHILILQTHYYINSKECAIWWTTIEAVVVQYTKELIWWLLCWPASAIVMVSQIVMALLVS